MFVELILLMAKRTLDAFTLDVEGLISAATDNNKDTVVINLEAAVARLNGQEFATYTEGCKLALLIKHNARKQQFMADLLKKLDDENP